MSVEHEPRAAPVRAESCAGDRTNFGAAASVSADPVPSASGTVAANARKENVSTKHKAPSSRRPSGGPRVSLDRPTAQGYGPRPRFGGTTLEPGQRLERFECSR